MFKEIDENCVYLKGIGVTDAMRANIYFNVSKAVLIG